MISLGALDGINPGDVAAFTARDSGPSLKTTYIGKALVAKIFPKYSIWYLKELVSSDSIFRGRYINIMRLSDIVEGKTSGHYHHQKVVAKSRGAGRVKQAVKGYISSVPNEITKAGTHYAPKEILRGDEFNHYPDDELVDIAVLKNDDKKILTDELEQLESLYIENLKKAPTEQAYDESKRKKFFEDAVKNQVQKVDENFNLEEFYSKQKKLPEYGQVAEHLGITNSLEDYQAKKDHKSIRRDEIKKWIEAAGARWSQDLSDEELSEFIEDHGIELEKKRQIMAKQHKAWNEFSISLGLNIQDKSSHLDTNQFLTTYSLSLGYDYLMLRRYPKLHRFSFDMTFRFSRDNLDMEDRNGKSHEFSGRFSLNYYPFNLPTSLEKAIFYFGTGLRYGQASIWTTSRDLKAEYVVNGFPLFLAGLKYRLREELGFKVLLDFERIEMRLQNIGRGMTHPNVLSFLEQKIELGLIYNF